MECGKKQLFTLFLIVFAQFVFLVLAVCYYEYHYHYVSDWNPPSGSLGTTAEFKPLSDVFGSSPSSSSSLSSSAPSAITSKINANPVTKAIIAGVRAWKPMNLSVPAVIDGILRAKMDQIYDDLSPDYKLPERRQFLRRIKYAKYVDDNDDDEEEQEWRFADEEDIDDQRALKSQKQLSPTTTAALFEDNNDDSDDDDDSILGATPTYSAITDADVQSQPQLKSPDYEAAAAKEESANANAVDANHSTKFFQNQHQTDHDAVDIHSLFENNHNSNSIQIQKNDTHLNDNVDDVVDAEEDFDLEFLQQKERNRERVEDGNVEEEIGNITDLHVTNIGDERERNHPFPSGPSLGPGLPIDDGWNGENMVHPLAFISQSDSWTVISKYFESCALAQQQISSYDEFVKNTIQEIIEDTPPMIAYSAPETSDDDGRDYRNKLSIEFGQVYITPPVYVSDDGGKKDEPLLPHMCRLRHYSYVAEVECEMTRKLFEVDDETLEEAEIHKDVTLVPIGKIPVMVNSMLCTLKQEKLSIMDSEALRAAEEDDYDDDDEAEEEDEDEDESKHEYEDDGEDSESRRRRRRHRRRRRKRRKKRRKQQAISAATTAFFDSTAYGECPFDQGGYFIINGREKVLVAQERMASNHVMCYKAGSNKKYWLAEIRCLVEASNRSLVANYVKFLRPPKGSPVHGNVFCVSIPYVKTDIALGIVFRALGFTSDKEILELIVYDFKDTQIMELCRPSLEMASAIQTREIALDYIGRRGVGQFLFFVVLFFFCHSVFFCDSAFLCFVFFFCNVNGDYIFIYVLFVCFVFFDSARQ